MATRKSGRSGGGGGGIKKGLVTGFMILMIVGFLFAWAQANNIKDFSGVISYLRAWTQEVEDCGIGSLEWNCSTPIPGYEGDKTPDPTVVGEEVEPGTPSAALAMLEKIKVADSEKVDYVRKDWKHWSDLDGNGCDTRKDTLIATGKNVVTDPKNCKVLSGTWVEPYANKTFTDASKMDIDHIVALSWAAANGGQSMPKELKEQLANDPLNLSISDATENRSKGDKGPSTYLPPNEAFQCEYVISFVSVVSKYDLTMPKADKDASRRVLETKC